MSDIDLKTAKKAVGAKQASKAVEKGMAVIVYLAADADQRIINPVKELCLREDVPVNATLSMRELGKYCGIEVGAAAVACLR